MPAPKDPEKRRQWIEKIKAASARRDCGSALRGRKQSQEAVARRAASLKKTYSDPSRRKEMSERAKKNGYGKWMKGKKLPHISESNKRRSGKTYRELYGDRAESEVKKRRESNRRRWEGTEREPQRDRHNGDWRYKEWRTKVYQRDDYTCQRCDKRGGSLQAHHIKQWALHPDLRYVVSNGVTYCEGCHKIVDTEGKTRQRKRKYK